MQTATRKYQTGLDFLDMRIGGGIPIDTVIALLAPPASQSQLLLRELTKEQRLVYLSTSVSVIDELETWLAETRPDRNEVTAVHTPPESLMQEVPSYLESAPPESFLVIDDIHTLETGSRSEYRQFLNDIHEWTRENDSIVILHCLDTALEAQHRSLTLNRVDQVWGLQLLLHSKDIITKLYITKARENRALTKPIPLIMTDDIRIDTSRNI